MVPCTYLVCLKCLYVIFIYKNNGNYSSKITRKRFREFLHANFDLSDDIIMDRIFKYFNTESADDIDLEEWIVGFSVILKGT